jgi:hypothetical protein
VQIWPNSPSVPGAGDNPEAIVDSGPPFPFLGDFKAEWSGGGLAYYQSENFTITMAGAVDITVYSRIFGYLSTGLTVEVGTDDGNYRSN